MIFLRKNLDIACMIALYALKMLIHIKSNIGIKLLFTFVVSKKV